MLMEKPGSGLELLHQGVSPNPDGMTALKKSVWVFAEMARLRTRIVNDVCDDLTTRMELHNIDENRAAEDCLVVPTGRCIK